MKCPNCNKELEDGARFCDECGAPIPDPVQEQTVQEQTAEQQAETQQPEAQQPESMFCPNCGKPLPAGALFCGDCGANLGPAGQPDGKKKKSSALIGGIIAACAAGVLVLVGVCVFVLTYNKDAGSKTDYAMYIKEKELFYSNLKQKTPSQVTEKLVDEADVTNSDFRYASYALSSYIVTSEDGKLLFFPDEINGDDDGVTLYYNKLSKLDGDATKIDSDVYGYVVSDNAAYVTYIKGEDTLYSYNLKKADKEKIAGDVEGYAASEDGKQVYYVNDEGTLYLWTMGKDKEKIDSDIYSVNYISDDFKTVYYIKEDNLYKRELKKEREKIASDVSSVLKVYDSGCMYYLKDAEEEVSMDLFVTDDMEEQSYVYMRDRMEDYTPDVDIAVLCYYDGKKETELSGGFSGTNYFASGAETVIFSMIDLEDIEKVKLSKVVEKDLSCYEIVDDAVQEATSYCLAQQGEVTVIDAEDVYSLRIDSDGERILYLTDYDSEEEEGDLYMMTVKNGKLSAAELIESDVYSRSFGFVGNSYKYYTDVKDYEGDLYIDDKSVAYDVYVSSDMSDSGVYYYYTDYDREKLRGTLNSYENGKSAMVAEDVYDFYAIGDKRVLILSNYSTSKYKGELYLYAGNKLKAVDDDVVCILRSYSYNAKEIYNYRGSRE